MVEFLFLQPFLIAIALGALIGLEREYARYKERGHQYAGIRTFPLIALLGALSAYLGDYISLWILLATMLLVGILILIAYFTVADRKHLGATSEIAGFLTFFIGVLCYSNEFAFATILTVIITVILYARSMLHHFAAQIKKSELSATLKFAVIAFIILPFLPNIWYGPHALFNPYIIWLMVVFISGISFVGYIVMKFVGEKAIPLTGLLGGVVSSTAATTSFTNRSRKEKRLYRALALGVILANGVMFIRILFVVFVLNRDLFVTLLLPVSILTLVTAIFSYFLWRKAAQAQATMELGSPFRLKPAIKFALLFAAVLAFAKIANIYLSSRGIYVVSFLSGLADADAIPVSLAQLAKGSLDLTTARNGTIIAMLANIAVKGGIAWIFGEEKFRSIIATFFGVLIALGIVLMVVL